MPDNFDYHIHKRPDRTYVSSGFKDDEEGRRLRFVSKVL
jgi:hypothetical protein